VSDSTSYGDAVAEPFDRWYDGSPESEAAADFLSGLTVDGPILELGVGTGRIARRLAERGFQVTGVDSSGKMLDRLRCGPGGQRVRTILGNIVDVRTGDSYDVVYLAFSTLFNLTSQDDQIACLRNAARHLTAAGKLVVEAIVPDPMVLQRGINLATGVPPGSATPPAIAELDVIAQKLYLSFIDGERAIPMTIRYAWPDELDLMARVSGLALTARYANWHRDRFGTGASRYVCVYHLDPSRLERDEHSTDHR
jgi:SAM-dependent methyltransferase